MATSLLGKADATIAGMSLKEAMFDVTPNLKGVYDQKIKTQALLQKEVETYFDGLNKENNALSDMLDETLNTTVEGAANERTQDINFDYINIQRDELEGVPNNKNGSRWDTSISMNTVSEALQWRDGDPEKYDVPQVLT